MNKSLFVGRITKTPIFAYVPDGHGGSIAKLNFFLAVKEQDRTDYPPFVVWGGYAEALANSLKKGMLVSVESRFQSTNYVEQGQQKVFYEFVVQKLTFL